MAARSSPAPMVKRPAPVALSKTYDDRDDKENEDSKERIRRKPLPDLPSPLGKMHGALRSSPVKINVEKGNRPPNASAAIVEGDVSNWERANEDERYTHGYHKPTGSGVSIVVDRPTSPTNGSRNRSTPANLAANFTFPDDNSGSVSSSKGLEATEPRQHDSISTQEPSDDYVEQPVPQFQYFHNSQSSDAINVSRGRAGVPSSDQIDSGQSINRHLTPTSHMGRNTPLQRPVSAYTDMGSRGRSPGSGLQGSPSWHPRAPSENSGRSYENRPMSYIDLQNMSYPQAPPAPISLDNSQLRSVVGSNASLLSMSQTLDMYRRNVKKLNDAETQYAFAIFLIQTAQESGLDLEESKSSRGPSPKPGSRDTDSQYPEKATPNELVAEAKHILQKLADRSYPFAQYFLGDGYASGLFNKGREDYGSAFPLFVAASKHGHAESGYRAALCYEFGWGTRKDPGKAVQFYRQSASKNHPGAMTRLGRACLSGDLGNHKYREGLKWLKRATESADLQYNAAPYHLALLYETGYGDDIFQDEIYAAQLFTKAADLGHAEACYRLGDAYEHGKLACPRDPALSVHFYTGAAQRGHPAAMMALCAWYMVGAEPVLERDEDEAYEWALQAAECGLSKAEYAVGYFTEMGIGTRRDPLEANVWYVRASEAGDERAKQRLAAIRAAASGGPPIDMADSGDEKLKKSGQGDKECVVM